MRANGLRAADRDGLAPARLPGRLRAGAAVAGLVVVVALVFVLAPGDSVAGAASAAVVHPGAHADPDADVIVIGAGIAGLAAALEASDAGATVLIVDANSVGGGHAIKAGGFALVGTPLQAAKGYQDSPDIAARDLLAWGEDADAGWVRRYVGASRADVHDWLGGFGVRFTFILDTPEHSVPRFHFAGGSARNVVVPMMRTAFARPNIEFRWNTSALALTKTAGAITGVRVRDSRTGQATALRGRAVIVATGGFEANLDLVRRSWPRDVPRPARLYLGAGQFATGGGMAMGKAAGGALTRLDHQVTFTTGLPDPRDPTGTRALLTQNPAAIWVNAAARRFVNENASTKLADAAVLRLKPATHWLIFDADGARSLRIRDAVWLASTTAPATLAGAPGVTHADTLRALAEAAGLPAAALEQTVARYNALVAAGDDADFGRFSPAMPDPEARQLVRPPFHAVQLYPLTRKSMGGLAIDDLTRVLDRRGRPVPGLYAAGEATGVAGINGSYGGEGTFLGPSVFTGRLAGRGAALLAGTTTVATLAPPGTGAPAAAIAKPVPDPEPDDRTKSVTLGSEQLGALTGQDRSGYWHFQAAHRIVLERGLDCLACHSPAWPTAAAATREQRQLQLFSCERCH